MPGSPARTFVLFYMLHIFTTVVIPIGLYVSRLISSIQTVILIILLAGFWTFVGVFFMKSVQTRQLRRFYALAGILLIAIGAIVFVFSF